MISTIIGPGVFILLGLAFLVVPIWTIIDAAGRPAWAFERAGTNKTLWIVLPIVGVILCGLLGLVAGIIYFASTRPKVIAASQGIGGPMLPGSPPPFPTATPSTPSGWYPDPARRHEYRYYDGSAWTSRVSDKGVEATDAL